MVFKAAQAQARAPVPQGKAFFNGVDRLPRGRGSFAHEQEVEEMGILKSPRERDLAEAAELREAVRQFEQENDRPTIEKYRRMFEPLLERAELLERRHGVVPGGSAAVLDRAAGPVANSVSGALTTQRERDLAQAADLRRAAAEQEKRDPEAAVKNRVFFEDMLRMAEELERKHGQPAASVNVAGSIPAAPVAHSSPLKNVEQPPPAVSPRAGYGFQGRSSTGEGACATGQDLFHGAAIGPPFAGKTSRTMGSLEFAGADSIGGPGRSVSTKQQIAACIAACNVVQF